MGAFFHTLSSGNIIYYGTVTLCPRSSIFYIVSYYLKWVTTSWTHSNFNDNIHVMCTCNLYMNILCIVHSYIQYTYMYMNTSCIGHSYIYTYVHYTYMCFPQMILPFPPPPPPPPHTSPTTPPSLAHLSESKQEENGTVSLYDVNIERSLFT